MADERAGGASGPHGAGSRGRHRPRSRFGRYGSSSRDQHGASRSSYAALDLGTNNCRLLVALPTRDSFRVVDAFSRIVRLGEGLGRTRRLADAAMDRAVDALRVCAMKLTHRNGVRSRLIAYAKRRTAA
jgi:exopolyphosphatase/guanosine-5'-triphosphate,3'-diphosphate pyrophosphatase